MHDITKNMRALGGWATNESVAMRELPETTTNAQYSYLSMGVFDGFPLYLSNSCDDCSVLSHEEF
jgi:hypothetical protein